MKKATLVLLFCMAMSVAFGQKRDRAYHGPTKAQERQWELNHQCLHRNKYTVAQRLKFYPFNKAAVIKLVSFEDYSAGPYPKHHINGDTTKRVNTDSIFETKVPFKDNRVNYTAFKEIKAVNKVRLNKLTDILYNVGYAGPKFIEDEVACYNPRNAILFIDAKGQTFAFIEICFECQKFRVSSEKIKMGEFCEQKYDLIKAYFKSAGIELGITRLE
jgi:hypothetical protein